MTLIVASLCFALGLSSCSRVRVPFVHRIDIQQGNVVTQEMVAQLRLGMDKKKVRYVMGTPIVQDTFHARRWDYIYTFLEGGGDIERRVVTVVFNEDGRLVNVEGDVTAALGRLEVDKHQDTSVRVPGEYEKGFFAKIKDSMPFTGDEPETVSASDADTEKTDLDDTAAGDADGEAALVAGVDDESVTVPETPPPKKERGFFRRIVDAVGLGAEEDDEEEEEQSYERPDPKYRDPTNPDDE